MPCRHASPCTSLAAGPHAVAACATVAVAVVAVVVLPGREMDVKMPAVGPRANRSRSCAGAAAWGQQPRQAKGLGGQAKGLGVK